MTTTDRMPPYIPSSKVRWGLPDAAVALGVFIGVQLLGIAVARLSGIRLADTFAVGLFNFVNGVLSYGAFALVLVVASRRRGLGTLAADFGLQFKPVDILLGIGGALLGKLAGVFFGILAVIITGTSPEHGNLALSPDSLWIILNAIVIASFVAPLVEELVFRGLILRAVRNLVLRRNVTEQPRSERVRTRAVVISILVSSAAFAALHLAQADSPAMLIVLGGSTFAVGIIHAALAIRTGRLGPSIISHALYNGSSVLLAILFASGTA